MKKATYSIDICVTMCHTLYISMRIDGLEWDDINIEHIITRHGINPSEVEDVCFCNHYVISVKFKRKAVYGKTRSGKYLMVILKRLYDNIYRPITARGMKPSERRKYNSIMN